jgi:magnesium-transporting ATPase (P-type)
MKNNSHEGDDKRRSSRNMLYLGRWLMMMMMMMMLCMFVANLIIIMFIVLGWSRSFHVQKKIVPIRVTRSRGVLVTDLLNI